MRASGRRIADSREEQIKASEFHVERQLKHTRQQVSIKQAYFTSEGDEKEQKKDRVRREGKKERERYEIFYMRDIECKLEGRKMRNTRQSRMSRMGGKCDWLS